MFSKEELEIVLDCAKRYTELANDAYNDDIYSVLLCLKMGEKCYTNGRGSVSKEEFDLIVKEIENMSEEETAKNIYTIGFIHGIAKQTTVFERLLREEQDLERLKQADPGQALLF